MALPTGLQEFQAGLSSTRKNHRLGRNDTDDEIEDDGEYIRNMALRIHAMHYVSEVIARAVKIFNNEFRRNSAVPDCPSAFGDAEASQISKPAMISGTIAQIGKSKSFDDIIPKVLTRIPFHRRDTFAIRNTSQWAVPEGLHGGKAEMTTSNFSESYTSRLACLGQTTASAVPEDVGEENVLSKDEPSGSNDETSKQNDCNLSAKLSSEELAVSEKKMKNENYIFTDSSDPVFADSGQSNSPVVPQTQPRIPSKAPPNTPVVQLRSLAVTPESPDSGQEKLSTLLQLSDPSRLTHTELSEETLQTFSAFLTNTFSVERGYVNNISSSEEEIASLNDRLMATTNLEKTRCETRMSSGEAAMIQSMSSRRLDMQKQYPDSRNLACFSLLKTATSIQAEKDGPKLLFRSPSRPHIKEKTTSLLKTLSLPGDLALNENFGILLSPAERRRLSLGPRPFTRTASSHMIVSRFACTAALEKSNSVPFQNRRRSSIEIDSIKVGIKTMGNLSTTFRKRLSVGELMKNINEEIPKTVRRCTDFSNRRYIDGVIGSLADENRTFQHDWKSGELKIPKNDVAEGAEKNAAERSGNSGVQDKVYLVRSTSMNSDSRTTKCTGTERTYLISADSHPSFWESDRYLNNKGSSQASPTCAVSEITTIQGKDDEKCIVDTTDHATTVIASEGLVNVNSTFTDKDPLKRAVISTSPPKDTFNDEDATKGTFIGEDFPKTAICLGDPTEWDINDPLEDALSSKDTSVEEVLNSKDPVSLTTGTKTSSTVTKELSECTEELPTSKTSCTTPVTKTHSSQERSICSNSSNAFTTNIESLASSEVSAKCRVAEDKFFAHPDMSCKIPINFSMSQSPRFAHKRPRSTPQRPDPSPQDTATGDKANDNTAEGDNPENAAATPSHGEGDDSAEKSDDGPKSSWSAAFQMTPVLSRSFASKNGEHLQYASFGRYKRKLEESYGNNSAGWGLKSCCQKRLQKKKTKDYLSNETEQPSASDRLPNESSPTEQSVGTPVKKQAPCPEKVQPVLATPTIKAGTLEKEISDITSPDPIPGTLKSVPRACSQIDTVETYHEDNDPPVAAPKCPGDNFPGSFRRERRFRFVLDVCRNCFGMGTGCSKAGDLSDSD